MGPEFDNLNGGGNFHRRKAPGERLFVHMRVIKDPGCQDILVQIEDFPFVGIVLPTGVIMADRDSQVIDMWGGLDDRDIDDIGFSRQKRAGDQHHRNCQQWGESHAVGPFFDGLVESKKNCRAAVAAAVMECGTPLRNLSNHNNFSTNSKGCGSGPENPGDYAENRCDPEPR